MKEEDVLKYVPGYTAPELDDLVYRVNPTIKLSPVVRLVDDSNMFIDLRKPEEILKVLKKIKKSCSKMKTCTSGCPFYNIGCCMFKKLGYLLYMNPEHWDIESIEKLLKEYD